MSETKVTKFELSGVKDHSDEHLKVSISAYATIDAEEVMQYLVDNWMGIKVTKRDAFKRAIAAQEMSALNMFNEPKYVSEEDKNNYW